MRGFIGNTDYDWYRFLAAQPDVDEVNFWQPSGGGGRFGAVSPGEPFFFRLKSPHNAIAGFGCFASYSALPAWLAWESFGRTNGAADFDEMRARIERYRRRSSWRTGADVRRRHITCARGGRPSGPGSRTDRCSARTPRA